MATKAMKTARVVVVGAGPAGIATATRLLERGFENVLILEAENRIGGRICTVPFADNVVDLGAQWCHGEKNNAIYEYLQERKLNLLDSTGTIYDDYKCVRSNREVVPDRIAEELKTIAFNSIPERQDGLFDYEGSLGAYLTDKYWQEVGKLETVDKTVAKEFFDNFKKFESSVEAADNLHEVSGKGHLEYWLCDGELLLNWKDKGFITFLRVLMKANQTVQDDWGVLNKRILLNKRVKRINWDREGVALITCWNGQIIPADHVICTISLGVLKENHTKIFHPQLPLNKCRAIDGLKLGTVNKFFLEFDSPFGPADWSGFAFLWLEKDLKELRASKYFWLESVFGFYRISYQPRVIGGWIIGPHGRHMETLPEDEVLEGLLWLFGKFFNFPIPTPKNFLRTQWYSNPNFRGSYTFRSLYTDELNTGAWDLAEPVTNTKGDLVLQFAGESTHDHYYSTVHGAVESGWREADRLVSYYQAKIRQAQL